MNLIELYRQIISTAGWVADEEGFISMKLADLDPQPVLIDGKRLVLPLDYQLKYPDTGKRVVFHPLNESILRGESDVVAKMRMNITHRLNYVIGYLAISMMRLATSPAEHPSLKPDQTVFLSKVKDADETTNDKLQKLAAQMTLGDPSRSFAHIYVSKRGDVDGRKYARVGVVSFPLYEELCKEEAEVYGVKLRKKDRQVIKALIEYIFPDIAKPQTYRRGSDSKVAPTLDALMKAVISVGDCINGCVELFHDRIEGPDELTFNGEWEPYFNDLESLLPQIRMIPMQAGNEGRVGHQAGVSASTNIPVVNLKTGAAPESVAKAAAESNKSGDKPGRGQTTSVVHYDEAAHQPQHRPRTLAELNTKQLDEDVAQAISRPQVPSYPQSMQPRPFAPMSPPASPYQNFAPPVANMAPAQVVHTGHGISMDSVMRADPALAAKAAAAGFGPQNVFPSHGYPQQQRREPSWAIPANNFGTTAAWGNFPNHGGQQGFSRI